MGSHPLEGVAVVCGMLSIDQQHSTVVVAEIGIWR